MSFKRRRKQQKAGRGEERERERESVCCSRERVTRACVRTHRARQPGDTRTKAHTSGEETERERDSATSLSSSSSSSGLCAFGDRPCGTCITVQRRRTLIGRPRIWIIGQRFCTHILQSRRALFRFTSFHSERERELYIFREGLGKARNRARKGARERERERERHAHAIVPVADSTSRRAARAANLLPPLRTKLQSR